MGLSRREMLLAGLGLLVTGCTGSTSRLTDRPRTLWPPHASRDHTGQAVSVPPPTPRAPRPAAGETDPLGAIARAQWTRHQAVPGRVNPMGGINCITVHHEGWKPFWSTDRKTTAERIELDRHVHVDNRGWGDIGYHYIIDRAGRIWQGRSIQHQGAHVADNNEHNVGVMCLGNFDQQRPSDAQVRTLINTLRKLRTMHNVPVSRIYTHQELKPTACPGQNLQPRMAAIRRNGYLA